MAASITEKMCERFDGLNEKAPPWAAGDGARNALRENLYRAVSYQLSAAFNFVKNPDLSWDFHQEREFIQPDSDPFPTAAPAEVAQNSYVALVSVLGMLGLDGIEDPSQGLTFSTTANGNEVVAGGIDSAGAPAKLMMARRFIDAVGSAVGEFNRNRRLFHRVYGQLRLAVSKQRGVPAPGGAGFDTFITPMHVAEVTRRLAADGKGPDDLLLPSLVDTVYQTVLGGGVDRRASSIKVTLPELDQSTQADIIAENVSAISMVYFAAMLEEVKFFAVAERIVDDFIQGRTPVSKGNGGQALYDYYRDATRRFTESERRGLYGRCFGLAQGTVDVPMANREFGNLWPRFLSTVSMFRRQNTQYQTETVTVTQAFKSARDMAVNLSLHGYGVAHFAAIEFQQHINDVLTMLAYPDVVGAYGARDVWQLVQLVSDMQLGGAVNSVRQRIMARNGAEVMQWLADNAKVLSGAVTPPNFLGGSSPGLPPAPLPIPEQKMVDNVNAWLAVTGTTDDVVKKYSEPVELRAQPTVPQLFSLSSMQGAQDAMRNAMQQLTSQKLPQA